MEEMLHAVAQSLYEAWRHTRGQSVQVTGFMLRRDDTIQAVIEFADGSMELTPPVHIPSAGPPPPSSLGPLRPLIKPNS